METSIEAQMNAQIVLNHIELHPEAHNQQAWASQTHECQTAGCIAGWTVMLVDGWKIEDAEYPLAENQRYAVKFFTDGNRHPDTRAMELLGLSTTDAEKLFFLHSEATAREALRYIANGKQIDWEKIGSEYDIRSMSEFEETLGDED